MKNIIIKYLWKLLGINRILFQQDQLINALKDELNKQNNKLENIEKLQKDIYMAAKFNDSIRDCKWLKYKSFSPGGWAIDYGLMYTLFRILNDTHPRKILEFGLGQSSKIIHQYTNYYTETQAITYEHDEKWINFFSNSKEGDYTLNIYKTDLEEIIYNDRESLSYKNNCAELKGQRFNLIVIDAPFGTKNYSRPQLLYLAPSILAEQFCIIMDDYERIGEQNTISELKKILKENKIDYKEKCYSYSKQHYIICSPKLQFLLSL